MWEKEAAEQTVNEDSTGRLGHRMAHLARVMALIFLLTLAVWVLPHMDGIFCSLSPDANLVNVSGVVRAAPHGIPLPQATVYSDRDLAVTEQNGIFRVKSGKGTVLRIEAPGFQPTQLRVKDHTPLIVLLFPDKDEPTEE